MGKVIVVGAGTIGLSVCEKLLLEGHEVTLVDHNEPGSQASYGHAGLIADFANKPLANTATLKSLPSMLLSKDSGVSLDKNYFFHVQRFGLNFIRSAFPKRFSHNRAILSDLLVRSIKSQQQMMERISFNDVISDNGCLHVYKTESNSLSDVKAAFEDKRDTGVACELLTKNEIASLEPELNLEGVEAAIFYPETKFLQDPLEHSKLLFKSISANPKFSYIAQQALEFEEFDNRVQVRLATGDIQGDHIVLCAGIHNSNLLKKHNIKTPIISERGYHISLEKGDVKLNRPVGWMGKFFFTIPMGDSIRVAGTTEFAHVDKAEDQHRYKQMKLWSEQMLGRTMKETDRWMGVRHSSPDGIPVISRLPKFKNVIACYGHGHLGLTMAGFSGDFIAQEIGGRNDQQLVDALSINRYL